MPDLVLGVMLSRGDLGLPDLALNDHAAYYLAPQFLGAAVQWNRTQVTSPYLDGAVTTLRSRQMVNEQVAIEVRGAGNADLQANLAALIAAFIQDSFTLTVLVEDATYAYRCEAADYQLAWTGPRFMAKQAQATFTVPRQPDPISGGV